MESIASEIEELSQTSGLKSSSRKYSESFETFTSSERYSTEKSTSSRKISGEKSTISSDGSIQRSETSNLNNTYSESFESSDDSISMIKIDPKLDIIVKKNIFEIVRRKINDGKNKKKIEVNYNQEQISKMIVKIIDRNERLAQEKSFISHTELDKDHELLNYNINSEVVNRLKTSNIIKSIKIEQLKKCDEFGEDLIKEHGLLGKDLEESKRILEDNSRKIYFKQKCDKIKKFVFEEEFAAHNEFYGDSIMMIGELARTLPKFSDPPEVVWKNFLQSLNKSD